MMRSPQSTTLGAPVPPWRLPPPWWQNWRRADLGGDLTAGMVVAIMLVPQSLAYALLAGLPPQVGLLASILPLIGYALFGSSRVLSVGPAAVTSLMLAQTLSAWAEPGSTHYLAWSAVLALGSGTLMLLMGSLRLGFLSQLLSRPVVQGFTVASAVLILVGQLVPLLGGSARIHTLPDAWAWSVATGTQYESWAAWLAAMQWSLDASIGLGTLACLWLGPAALTPLLQRIGLGAQQRLIVVRLWPLVVLLGAAGVVWAVGPHTVQVVGAVALDGPSAWQSVAAITSASHEVWVDAMKAIALITLVSFVSSVASAQVYAIREGERLDADRECLGLAAANIGSALLGGMAVSGGLSRTVVNHAAGARSPLAGVITAVILAVGLLVLLPGLAYLPKSALAAVIIAAVVNLVEWRALRQAWRYDKGDAWAFVVTAAGVLFVGFDVGIGAGLTWSLAVMVWRHSQPHIAEVGRVPGTEHFRNVERYEVEQLPGVIVLRVDESLDFTNIQRVEAGLCQRIRQRCEAVDVVLLLSAVNHLDLSAVQTLLELDRALADQGKRLYLAEIKGPVMDRLKACRLDRQFEGRIFLSAQHAWDALLEVARRRA